MKNTSNLSVKQAFLRQLLIISIGPALVIVAGLLGGDMTDGFAGSTRSNSQFGEWLLWLSSILTWIGLAAAFVLGCWFSIKSARENKRYMLLLLTPLMIVPIMIVVFVINAMVL